MDSSFRTLKASAYFSGWCCDGDIPEKIPLDGLAEFEGGDGFQHLFAGLVLFYAGQVRTSIFQFKQACADREVKKCNEMKFLDSLCMEEFQKELQEISDHQLETVLKKQLEKEETLQVHRHRREETTACEEKCSPLLESATIFFLQHIMKPDPDGKLQPTEERVFKKIQKLLFYTDALNIFQHGAPLFSEEPNAFREGPCYEPSRRQLHSWWKSKIEPQVAPGALTPDHLRMLNSIWNHLGGKGHSELERLSHRELPWALTPYREPMSRAFMIKWFKGERGQSVLKSLT